MKPVGYRSSSVHGPKQWCGPIDERLRRPEAALRTTGSTPLRSPMRKGCDAKPRVASRILAAAPSLGVVRARNRRLGLRCCGLHGLATLRMDPTVPFWSTEPQYTAVASIAMPPDGKELTVESMVGVLPHPPIAHAFTPASLRVAPLADQYTFVVSTAIPIGCCW